MVYFVIPFLKQQQLKDEVGKMKIAILLFDNYTALDVVGPYEVLSNIPGAKIYFAAEKPGLYKNNKGIQISADYSLDEIADPEIVVIPGGFGIDAILDNEKILRWVNTVHKESQWTTSVCSGALLLAAAGILNGRKVITHWNRIEQLKKYPVEIVKERYIRDGKIITSAGVSAGIDMALYLTSLVVNENFAKVVQLSMEYDPKPPFDSGSPEKAPKEIVEMIKAASRNNKIEK
jgi:transcriptional regulator GlxA family with amidase domain